MKTIEERVKALERSNRRYRLLFVGIGLALMAGLLVAASKSGIPNLIRAKAFHVVNDAGKTMVSIHYVPSGTCPWGDEGGAINLFKNNGQIALLASAHGRGGKIVTYKSKKASLFLAHPGQDGGGLAAVFDKQGKVIWSAPAGLTLATLQSQIGGPKPQPAPTQAAPQQPPKPPGPKSLGPGPGLGRGPISVGRLMERQQKRLERLESRIGSRQKWLNKHKSSTSSLDITLREVYKKELLMIEPQHAELNKLLGRKPKPKDYYMFYKPSK